MPTLYTFSYQMTADWMAGGCKVSEHCKVAVKDPR